MCNSEPPNVLFLPARPGSRLHPGDAHLQLGRTVLWAVTSLILRLPDRCPSHRHHSAYNEGAMVEKRIAASRPRITGRTGWKSSASTTAPPMTPGSILSKPSGATSPPPAHAVCANRGKKEGLYAGFTRAGARSSSPSIRQHHRPDALRTWWPLAARRADRAVAGNVKVYNRNQSLMGRCRACAS